MKITLNPEGFGPNLSVVWMCGTHCITPADFPRARAYVDPHCRTDVRARSRKPPAPARRFRDVTCLTDSSSTPSVGCVFNKRSSATWMPGYGERERERENPRVSGQERRDPQESRVLATCTVSHRTVKKVRARSMIVKLCIRNYKRVLLE